MTAISGTSRPNGTAQPESLRRAAAANGGSCTVCHDVHKTVLENVDGQSDGATAECTACHSNPSDTLTPQVTIVTIKHPSGTGTPLDYSDSCVVCHMPGGQHLFRISTDANYTEFPDAALTADMPAPTAKDADGFDAVWVDLDKACGQCHGGGTSQTTNPSKAGIMYFNKPTLAVYAAGMHAASKLPPTVGNTALVSPVLKGTPVSFIDASKDNNHQSIASVYVNWGDGQTTTGAAGATFSHTYVNAGKYNIVHTATDAGGRVASELIAVQVMSGTSTTKTKITVNVTDGTNPIGAARLYLKKGTTLVTTGYSNAAGTWTFSNLNPDANYNVTAYKSGVNFGAGIGKMSAAQTADTSAPADVTLTFTSMP